MDAVTVKVELGTNFHSVYNDVVVLKTFDDIMSYDVIRENRVVNDFKRYLKSDNPSHEKYGAEMESVFIQAEKNMTVIEILDKNISDTKKKQWRLMELGYHIIVNKNGGWFNVYPSKYEIISKDPEFYMEECEIEKMWVYHFQKMIAPDEC